MWKYAALALVTGILPTQALAHGAMAYDPATGVRTWCMRQPTPRAAIACAAAKCGENCSVRKLLPGTCRYEGVTPEGDSFWSVGKRELLAREGGIPRLVGRGDIVSWECDDSLPDHEPAF